MRRTIIVSNSMSYFRTQRFYRLRLGDIRRYIYIYIWLCKERRGVSRRTFGRQVVARERQGLSGLRRCCCKGCIEGIGRRGVVCRVREELKLEKNYDE